jgi:hypothetical protein
VSITALPFPAADDNKINDKMTKVQGPVYIYRTKIRGYSSPPALKENHNTFQNKLPSHNTLETNMAAIVFPLK